MTEPSSPDDPQQGLELEELVGITVANKYKVIALLGRGGMGAVYEGENLALGKRVAIKFVDREYAKDERVTARFAREARAASSIESAHIVTVFDAGVEDGRPYLVMELLRGEDVGARLRARGELPVVEALHVIAQLLVGLSRAHDAGIIHRDLKPDNVILVPRDGDPHFAKIVDFGISKIQHAQGNTAPLALTQRGTVLGTPYYMSPEQAQSAPDLDARADLYSVGAILFECLAGRPPHIGQTYEQVIVGICMQDAPDVRTFNKDVPADVADFVKRSLSRDRTQRFDSAAHMLAALIDIAPAERTKAALDVLPSTSKRPHTAPSSLPLSSSDAFAPTLPEMTPRSSDDAWSERAHSPEVPALSNRTPTLPLPQQKSAFGLPAIAIVAAALGALVVVGTIASFTRTTPPPTAHEVAASSAVPSAIPSAVAAPAASIAAPEPAASMSARNLPTASARPSVAEKPATTRSIKPAEHHSSTKPNDTSPLDLARDLP
jgi:serine/threonine protein kinase